MRYRVDVAGRVFEVRVDDGEVRLDGEVVDAALLGPEGSPVRRLVVDGRGHRVWGRPEGDGPWTLTVGGEPHEVEVLDERAARARDLAGSRAAAGGPKPMRAPMPGLVLRVEVEEGEPVARGQGLVIVEAMKMENELRAAAEGRVERVHVSPGQTVEKDDLLVEFAADGRGGDAADGPVR